MPATNFACTLCGKCCHNHSLPLTLEEAIRWLEDGGNLAIFCEARPWPRAKAPSDARAMHQKKRSFPVPCGSSEARVTAILVGIISGACMHLGEDMKCRIYDRRPLVCRIYPAEISPFVQFSPSAKACPPEAWQSDDVLLIDGQPIEAGLQSLIKRSRQTDRDEAGKKGYLCSELGISVAGINDEGFVAHEPERNVLLHALRRALLADVSVPAQQPTWRLYSREPSALAAAGFAMISEKSAQDRFTFLHAPRAATESASVLAALVPAGQSDL